MDTHKRRVELLADALSVKPSDVVATLRAKNELFYDANGVLLFDPSGWPEERLVEAAVKLFVTLH